ncbi:MAG: hypothetical protein ACK5JI_00905 [Azonexus sp.]
METAANGPASVSFGSLAGVDAEAEADAEAAAGAAANAAPADAPSSAQHASKPALSERKRNFIDLDLLKNTCRYLRKC